ncbi:MAG: hypothetical protein PW792_14315 [Acidobacteriaceae bacterium]|nr:hypothetical protein [Acidobacteriaceae bacterium]
MAVCFVAMSLAIPVAAQNTVVSTGGHLSALMAPPVVGEPYSAVQTTSVTQTLSDGTTMKRHGHHSVYRDAQGRVRVESRILKALDDRPEMKLVYVKDPVAGTFTVWSEGGPKGMPRVATVSKLSDTSKAQSRTVNLGAAEPKKNPNVTTEDLGSQIIDGLACTGKRTTVVIPAGKNGNDKAITRTHEVWTSEEMKLIVLQKETDPRTGERVVQLEKLLREQPDSALFRAPQGYKVQTSAESLKQLAQKLEAAADKQE